MNYPDYISHHGIKGQKWGVRRYQNADGTLTPEGKKRYIRNQTATTSLLVGAMGAYGGAITGGVGAGFINPAFIPMGMKVGAIVGGTAAGYKAGKYTYDISKEATKGKIRWDKVHDKAMQIADDRAYAKRDFKKAFEFVKNSGYFDTYEAEAKKDIFKIAKQSKNFDDFNAKIIKKYGDHPGDLIYEELEKVKIERKKAAGSMYINSQAASQANNMMVNQEHNRIAIQEANRAASLSLTNGTNPFMFG